MARKPKQDSEQSAASGNIDSNPAIAEKIASSVAKADEQKTIAADGTKFTDAEYRSRCGGALRLAREKQGLSTRDVANQLRLSVKQVEAIEADNFAALPEPTIVKGFIRNYARFLKLPLEPLLDAYLVLVPNKTQHSLTIHPASGMRLNNPSKSTGSRRYFLILLAVLSAVALWFFYQGYIQKPSPVLPSIELKEPLPEAALPMAERNNSVEEVLPLPGSNATALNPESGTNATPPLPIAPPASSDGTTTVPNEAAVKAPSTPATTRALPAEQGLMDKTPLAQPQLYRLEFNASQETWVSVVDAAGKEVYNKVLFSGNREVIEVKPPLNIVVGNSHGATLTVNNQAVDLAPHTRVNVARLRVD